MRWLDSFLEEAVNTALLLLFLPVAFVSGFCQWRVSVGIYVVREHYAGVPACEVVAFAELMNALELQHLGMFGDSVSAAIVTNIKAADLKGQQVSIRGLARVIGLQPSTIRRRIAGLIEQGWLAQDATGLHFPDAARERGAPMARAAMLRFALALNKLGWGDFHPPP